jgi:hypothetical protein
VADGTALAERRTRIARNYAQWLAYAGKRRGEAAGPTGVYRGDCALYRGSREKKVFSLVREVRIATTP